MFRNYLTVAFRNLYRNKFFSALNIFGLALGMTCSLLILLWVKDEVGVDRFHANLSRLYAIHERMYYDKKVVFNQGTTGVLADELQKKIPEIEYAVGVKYDYLYTFQAGNKNLKEKGGFAGADYFRMFSYPLLAGDAATALRTPESIAISRKMATALFGGVDRVVGKTIRFEDRKDMKVTAVFEDLPANVSERFDYLINWQLFLKDNKWANEWGNFGPMTMIQVKPGSKVSDLRRKLLHFLDNYPVGQSNNYKVEMDVQPFGERYLHSANVDGRIEGGRIQYVYLFSIVAGFILLIACINFMNLMTAHSVRRAKEIGIRKVVGALRGALVRQFVGEAIMLAVIAAVVAVCMIIAMLPYFNQLTGKQIELHFSHPFLWLSLMGLTLITGFVSGSYPAFFLSGFEPIRVLKGVMKFGGSAAWLRKGLVVFQFALSIILIVSTIIISRQIGYIQNRNLGYDRESLIYIPLEGQLVKKFNLFEQGAKGLEGVTGVTRMGESATEIQSNTFGIDWDGKNPNETQCFYNTSVGYDFASTMKLQFAQGRDFQRDHPTDSSAYLINETALKRIGYKDPIGKSFTMWGMKGPIIGVLKDYHFGSMHKTIEPLVVRMAKEDQQDNILVRIRAGKMKETLASLGALCREINPKYPFTYQFSDEEFAKMYKSEEVIGRLSKYFAGLAIFICCLGLLGLTLFMTEQRTKEIGIRKVLGASVGSIFVLLSKEFLGLVMLAILIATPVAWFAMHRWLQDYAYYTDISWWIFPLAGVLAFLIALATMSLQSVRAALANPVRSLRAE